MPPHLSTMASRAPGTKAHPGPARLPSDDEDDGTAPAAAAAATGPVLCGLIHDGVVGATEAEILTQLSKPAFGTMTVKKKHIEDLFSHPESTGGTPVYRTATQRSDEESRKPVEVVAAADTAGISLGGNEKNRNEIFLFPPEGGSGKA